jgi:hypothetical protein
MNCAPIGGSLAVLTQHDIKAYARIAVSLIAALIDADQLGEKPALLVAAIE